MDNCISGEQLVGETMGALGQILLFMIQEIDTAFLFIAEMTEFTTSDF